MSLPPPVGDDRRWLSAPGVHVDPPPPVQGPRVIGHRVDWLTSAHRVELSEAVLGEFRRRLDLAREVRAGRVAVVLDGLPFELRQAAGGAGGKLIARNADVAVVIEPEARTQGWTVSVECPGAFMMSTGIADAVALSRRLARALGTVLGERVRRLDLCCDVAGWSVGEIPDDGWCQSGRPRRERASAAALEKPLAALVPELRQYHRGAQLTGYTVCPGGELCAVIYDKREELSIRRDKRAAEQERWSIAGWDGRESVTRTEFRWRSQVLDELGVRDGLDAFAEQLDELWQYACRIWLRVVNPATGDRPSRRAPVDAWRVVQEVQFTHQATPAIRVRRRGGATAASTFGCVLSMNGSAGALPPPQEVVREDGLVLDETDTVALLSDDECVDLVHGVTGEHFARASNLVARDFCTRLGARPAAKFVLVRERAAHARFSPSTQAAVEEVERLRRAVGGR